MQCNGLESNKKFFEKKLKFYEKKKKKQIWTKNFFLEIFQSLEISEVPKFGYFQRSCEKQCFSCLEHI